MLRWAEQRPEDRGTGSGATGLVGGSKSPELWGHGRGEGPAPRTVGTEQDTVSSPLVQTCGTPASSWRRTRTCLCSLRLHPAASPSRTCCSRAPLTL